MMHEHGKSDSKIVPEKSANKVGLNSTAAEQMEGSALTEGNEDQQNTCQTQGWESVQHALALIRQKARADKKMRFTALMHHVYNFATLKHAYLSINRDVASGVDKETWDSYGAALEENLRDLSRRLKQGAYHAKPVRRTYIPKPDGRQRPLGVTALEDKVVQRATIEVLNAIYETDFMGFSYGFRPGRSQHQALDALDVALMTRKVGWILDADIRDYFSSINHEWMVKFLEHRIVDRRVVRLIQKWLKAGVLEDGEITRSEEGAPQGGCASPLLSNVFLHYVYDLWIHQWRQRRARGEMIVVRFADDTIVGFQYKSDADQFLNELKERFRKFGLELHPDKTRLIQFGRFATQARRERGLGKPETFAFLGFTHACGRTRTGKFMVARRTVKERLHAKVKAVRAELEIRMHSPIPEVGQWLQKVLRGHYQYYGVPGNYRAIDMFRHSVYRAWRWILSRRSDKANVTWETLNKLIDRWLPPPHITHPHPSKRFAVRTQGRSRVR